MGLFCVCLLCVRVWVVCVLLCVNVWVVGWWVEVDMMLIDGACGT